MKVLVKNESPRYSSETILHKGLKFKIVSENGNAYSHLRLYIYTKNGDLAMIAQEDDVNGYKRVQYHYSNEERILGNTNNIKAAEKYIKAAYADLDT